MKKPELAHLINLIAIAMVDGTISEQEKTVLYNIAEALGATNEEFNYCVNTALETKDRVIIEVPDTDEEKTFFLKNLTLMMMSDGVIDENEKNYIKFIAEKFGYDGDKALGILIESVTNDIRESLNKQKGNSHETASPASTRETGKTDVKIDEEQLKAEIRQAVQQGKEALMRHDIPTAFDHLVHAAHLDAKAMRLFLMIINIRQRLFRLSKEQVSKLETLAGKGYALSQYAYGRWLEAHRPESDSLNKANEYFKDAEKGGFPDALFVQAILMKAGHYGLVNRTEVAKMIDDAADKGSFLADKYLLRQNIFGWNDTKVNPQIVINVLKEWLNGTESDDIMEVDPAYYSILGEAFEAIEDKQNADKYYRKAINMGYTEAWGDLYYLHANDDEAEDILESGCDIADPGCLVCHAINLMNSYDEMSKRDQKTATSDIMDDLITAYENGSDMAPCLLGKAYYYGDYGFGKDNTKAWNWFIEGSHRDDGESYKMLAVMASNDEIPYEVSDNAKLMEHLAMMAVRNGDEDMLDVVVEGYRNGDLTDYATEIEQYYIPQYDRLHENDDDEDTDPDDYDYKLMAIVKTNGKADIFEFDVEEGWDELPDFIGAKRLDAIRTQPLYDITQKLRLDGHITAWVDNMGLMKDLPMNPIGCQLYPGPIAGDMILTLEDAKYNPMSFESLEVLKQVIAALGAQLDKINLDDGPDDDGRYDAWS